MRLETKNLYLDLVEEEDAEFILKLRRNPELNEYISDTDTNLEKQKEWIKSYKKKEKESKEFYFIVKKRNELTPCGTVRIYNINGGIATWGSFILSKERPNGASYEVVLETIKFAFEKLNLKKILLDVRKENRKAIYVYEKMGFIKYKEDLENYYYFFK